MISHRKLESGVPKLAMVPGASRWEYQAPYQGVLLRQKGCWVRWAVSRQRCGLKCWRGPTTLHDSGVRFWKTRHSRTSRAVARAWGEALWIPHLPSSRGLGLLNWLRDWRFLPGKCCCVHFGVNISFPESSVSRGLPQATHRDCVTFVSAGWWVLGLEAKLSLKLDSFKPHECCRDRIVHLSPIPNHPRKLIFTKIIFPLI